MMKIENVNWEIDTEYNNAKMTCKIYLHEIDVEGWFLSDPYIVVEGLEFIGDEIHTFAVQTGGGQSVDLSEIWAYFDAHIEEAVNEYKRNEAAEINHVNSVADMRGRV